MEPFVLNVRLELIEAIEQVRRRLLIARRRFFQVCQRALELNGFIVVLEETSGDGGNKGHTDEAIKGLLREELGFYNLVSGSIFQRFVRRNIPPELTMSPQTVGCGAGGGLDGLGFDD